MASLTIVQGTVKYAAGPVRDTKNGPRINVVVTLADGEETKLWGDSGDPTLVPLRKGNAVQLVKNAKGTGYSLLDTSPGTPADPPVTAHAPGYSPRQRETWKPWTDEEKKQLAAKIDQESDLLHYCLQTARKKFFDSGLVETEESVCSLASVLFSQATEQ
ncbi:MAG: hypothetical protein WCA35_14805 [Kovacikia sp.]